MGLQDELLDGARAETGLTGFGDDAFREGLERLTRALETEARLHTTGQAVLRPPIGLRYPGAPNVEHWSVRMERALAFRDSGADGRFHDIDFRAMRRDPLG